jgi:hypothetical protein
MAIWTRLATWSMLLLLTVSVGAQSGFIDDPVVAGVTVRAVHVTELRSRVNAVRSATGLAAFTFTDATLAAGITPVRAVHLGELRTAISQAYVAVGRMPPAFTDPGIQPRMTLVRAVHISELRAAVIALEGNLLPSDSEDPLLSTAVVTLANLVENSFNNQLASVRFEIANGQFSVNPDHVSVFHRREIVDSAQVQVSATAIVVSGILVDGPNEIELLARDSVGRYIDVDATVWAGSATLTGQVVNESGQPIAGAAVSVRLGIDALVRASMTTTGTGEFSFSHVPAWTMTLEAAAPGNRHASSSVRGDSDFVVLEATAIGPPSSIDNNDFSQGTAGWEVGTAPVEIIPHEEEGASDTVRAAADPDFDLKLNTFGEGAQRVSRTFNVDPGSRFVKIRYRFVTSEVPGGFFGTEFDDAFSVSVRSQQGQGVISESASMNSLGLGAFDANGATSWRETSLPVSELGDIMHVDVSVANVADDLFDSYVVIDAVAENSFALSDVELRDIDDSPLKFLSLSPHSYFGGRTRIHGELTIAGDDEDGTFTITLEVIQRGEIRAVGQFIGAQPAARQSVATNEFEYTFEGPLFEIDSTQLGMIDPADASLFLLVRARTATGKQSIFSVGRVILLVRFPHSNRFGDRNASIGGDDWAQPMMIVVAQHFSSNTYGDFSNMNAGDFPPHAGHRHGASIDGWFPGYSARNAATAARIIEHLNDAPHGSRIARVLVTFEKVGTDPFWNAIANVVLNDGRRARDIIRPAGGYQTRFHWDGFTEDPVDVEAAAVARGQVTARARGR